MPPTSLLSFSVVCVGGYLSCQPIWKHSHTSGKVLFSPQRTVFIPYPSSHASSTALVRLLSFLIGSGVTVSSGGWLFSLVPAPSNPVSAHLYTHFFFIQLNPFQAISLLRRHWAPSVNSLRSRLDHGAPATPDLSPPPTYKLSPIPSWLTCPSQNSPPLHPPLGHRANSRSSFKTWTLGVLPPPGCLA